jgi:hypothetical protein
MTDAMLFTKSKIQRDFSQLNKLIYGFAKSGKTTLAAEQKSFDGRLPLFIATEDGHHALEVYVQRVSGWDGFCKLVVYLKKNEAAVRKQHSCLVVDVLTDLDDMCSEFVSAREKVKHLSDLEYGKGFAMQKMEMQNQLRVLFDILPVTFITHTTEKEMMWNNEKLKMQSAALSKGTLNYVNGKVDLIIMILPANNKKLQPELTMRNSTTCIAGSRYKQLVRNFPFDTANPGKTYDLLQKTFAGSEQPAVPSEDQHPSTTEADAMSDAVN